MITKPANAYKTIFSLNMLLSGSDRNLNASNAYADTKMPYMNNSIARCFIIDLLFMLLSVVLSHLLSYKRLLILLSTYIILNISVNITKYFCELM